MSADRAFAVPRRIRDPHRLQDPPVPARPDLASLLALQRSAGNQAVARILSTRTLQREFSKGFIERRLDQGAWPNVPTAGGVKAIADRAATDDTVDGVAGRLVNEIGKAMQTDQRLDLITETLRKHANDKDVDDRVGEAVIDAFKAYLAERTPDVDEKNLDADLSARNQWATGLTKPDKKVKKYRFLVSSIDTSKRYGLERFRNPWLFTVQAASMSLISPEHPHTYRDFGYIFDVPPECILVAAADDIGTSNTAYDAGAESIKKEIETKLVQADTGIRTSEAIEKLGKQPESTVKKSEDELRKMAKAAGVKGYKKMDKDELEAALDKRIIDYSRAMAKEMKGGGGKPALRGPEDILKHTGKAGHVYNEIYVAGTSLDGTKQIKPSGIFYNPDAYKFSSKKPLDDAKQAEWDAIQQMSEELKLPLVSIKQPEIKKTKPKEKGKEEKKEKEKVTL